MNNKGFTLIELIATLVLIALITVIAAPPVLTSIQSSKNKDYEILVQNIKTAAIELFEECKYNYKSSICPSSGTNTMTITIKELANSGFLNAVSKEDCTGSDCKIIKNPKEDQDMGICKLKITESSSSNYKVTYNIQSLSPTTQTYCPTTSDYARS